MVLQTIGIDFLFIKFTIFILVEIDLRDFHDIIIAVSIPNQVNLPF